MNEPKKINRLNQDFNPMLLMNIFVKNIKWIVLSLVIGYLVCFIYLRYTIPIYEAKGVVQTGATSNSLMVSDDNNPFLKSNFLSKKLDLLTSKTFLTETLTKLNLQINYFVKGTVLDYEIYDNTPFVIDPLKFPASVYQTPIYVSYEDENLKQVYYEKNHQKINLKIQKDPQSPQRYILTEKDFELILTQKAATPDVLYFFYIIDSNLLYETYAPFFSASVLNDRAQTIEMSFQYPNAQKANHILDAILQNFSDYDKVQQQEDIKNITTYIDQQLLGFEDVVNSAEQDIFNYKLTNQKDIFDSLSSVNLLANYTKLTQDIAELDRKEQLFNKFQTAVLENENLNSYQLLAQIAGGEYEGSLNSYIANIQKLLIEKERYMYDFTENSGKIKRLDYDIALQKKFLQEIIISMMSKYKADKKILEERLANVKVKLLDRDVNTSNREFHKLSRILKLNQNFYDKLVETKVTYSIAAAGITSKNKILNFTAAHEPISPNTLMAYIVILGIVLLVNLGNIALQYLYFNKIQYISDVQDYTCVSCLGQLPLIKETMLNSVLLVDKEPKSVLAESLRKFRSNMHFIDRVEGCKIVTVTSTISGEGKTFTIINLASIFAYAGKKVIVLDLDMRKPKIHIAFSDSQKTYYNKYGMSQLLIGDAELEKVIQNSRQEYLDFIPAGIIPPNPSELLLSEKFDEIVESLKQKYDYIFMDAPPIGLVSDGMKCLQIAQFPIYVFMSNRSQKEFIHNMNAIYESYNLRNLSFIVNAVDVETKSYRYASSYYGREKYAYDYGGKYGDYVALDNLKSPWWKKLKKYI